MEQLLDHASLRVLLLLMMVLLCLLLRRRMRGAMRTGWNLPMVSTRSLRRRRRRRQRRLLTRLWLLRLNKLNYFRAPVVKGAPERFIVMANHLSNFQNTVQINCQLCKPITMPAVITDKCTRSV